MRAFALPMFMRPEVKTACGIALWLISSALYLTTNHFHIVEPVTLHMTWIDQATPFMPATFWIYFSEYLLFVFTFQMCKDMDNLQKYFYSFLALQMISNLIFLFWPTTYPRELFPIGGTDPITTFTFEALRRTDSPANCCPSLHVSSVFLSSFVFLNEQRKKFPLFFGWAAAIAVSTLTTKQHYLIDVFAGLTMAAGFYWVFYKVLRYRPWGEFLRSPIVTD